MFRRLLLFLTGAVMLAGAGGVFLYNTEDGQDFLLRFGMKSLLSPPPAIPPGLRVVICGSASPLGNDRNRAQACIAVVTAKHFLLFDTGAGSPLRIAEARLPVDRLTGVFLTHYHSDHISGLPDVNLARWVRGRSGPLEVYGPPGVETVVEGFNLAFSLDRGYRVAHHGPELLPPGSGILKALTFTPGEVVWQDDELRVTSFPVSHPPIEPAVGYRVDYMGRSVVISGDSNASESLFRAAKGADILLHDALSLNLLEPMIEAATELGVPRLPTIMTDVIDYHAEIMTLPERASAAGIRQLAYYHLVPGPPNSLTERVFRRGLPPEVLLVEDLQIFDLPPHSDEIHITDP